MKLISAVLFIPNRIAGALIGATLGLILGPFALVAKTFLFLGSDLVNDSDITRSPLFSLLTLFVMGVCIAGSIALGPVYSLFLGVYLGLKDGLMGGLKTPTRLFTYQEDYELLLKKINFYLNVLKSKITTLNSTILGDYNKENPSSQIHNIDKLVNKINGLFLSLKSSKNFIPIIYDNDDFYLNNAELIKQQKMTAHLLLIEYYELKLKLSGDKPSPNDKPSSDDQPSENDAFTFYDQFHENALKGEKSIMKAKNLVEKISKFNFEFAKKAEKDRMKNTALFMKTFMQMNTRFESQPKYKSYLYHDPLIKKHASKVDATKDKEEIEIARELPIGNDHPQKIYSSHKSHFNFFASFHKATEKIEMKIGQFFGIS